MTKPYAKNLDRLVRFPQDWGPGGGIPRPSTTRLIAAAGLLLALASTSQAATPPSPAPAATRDSRDAFALGYALEYSHLRAYDFIDSVKQLRDISDDTAAGVIVARLTERGDQVRRIEADTYGRASVLIDRLHGPAKALRWTGQNAAALAKPLAFTPKAGISPEEKMTDRLAAAIDDTSRVQKELIGMLAPLISDLRARHGAAAAWAFDAGTYSAKVRLWPGDVDDVPMLQKEARALAATEPAGTPADADRALRAVIAGGDHLPSLQKGMGNLSALLPGRSVRNSAAALGSVTTVLTADFDAADLVDHLDGDFK